MAQDAYREVEMPVNDIDIDQIDLNASKFDSFLKKLGRKPDKLTLADQNL